MTAVVCELPPTTPTLTGKQKLALSLERAGYSHSQIAFHMGLKCRESATRLISRARIAQRAFQKEAMRYMEMD